MKIFLIIVTLFAGVASFAQQRKIVGRVLDADTRKPLKNTNIVVLGTTIGTFSNYLGFFELLIDPAVHKSLILSHTGYTTSELSVPDLDPFQCTLTKQYIRLKQVDLADYPKQSMEINQREDKVIAQGDLIAIETNGSFPGGMDNFYEYLGNFFASRFTEDTALNLDITFTIDESGKAIDVVTSDSTASIKAAVTNLFEGMPSWNPGTQRQVAVRQFFKIAIIRAADAEQMNAVLKDLYEFFGKNIRYPVEAKRMGIEGVIYVEFRTDNSGRVLSSSVIKDIGGDCGKEVMRLVSAIPSKIITPLTRYTNANSFILPVSFGLDRRLKRAPHPHVQASGTQPYLLNELAIVAVGIERSHK